MPFPEDDYLLALARLCYAISYLEWAILGDLPRIPGLPSTLGLRRLVGLTTEKIGQRLGARRTLAQVQDPRLRSWLEAAGNHLLAVSATRNAVLHARPATIEGRQRLNRWHPLGGEVFPITESFLAGALADIDNRLRDLSARRLI